MTWKEVLIGIPLAVLGVALFVVTALGVTLTRTEWGRAQVRNFALQRLNTSIRGEVQIDHVLEGDLLRRVGLVGIRIYEPDGELFAAADTLIVDYRWWDVLFGNVVFPKVTIVGPQVRLSLTSDGRWNAIELFRGAGGARSGIDPDLAEPSVGGRRIVLRELSIRSGDVTLRMPWDPAAGTNGGENRWRIEGSDGSWERVFRIDRLNATLPFARVHAPQGQSRLFQIVQANGRVTVLGDPVQVEQLRADVEIRGDTVAFDVWEGVLPGSNLFGQGWVALGGDQAYDLELRGNPVSARDFLWLEPRLPAGTAYLDFRLRSLENGVAFEAQNARWESADAKLSGRFAMRVMEGTERFQFDSVQIETERLNTTVIRSLTGWDPPIAGILSGRAYLDGRLSALNVDADLEIEPDDSEEISRVSVRGIVNLNSESLGAQGLELQFDTLQLDLVRAFLPDLAVRGRVVGFASADGRLADGMGVYFEIEQRDRGLIPTRLSGGGSIVSSASDAARLDLAVDADVISLSTLAAYYPVIPFRGNFRGHFRATGPVGDLELNARLIGASDSITIDSRLHLDEDIVRYEGEMRGWRVQLAPIRPDLPESDLDFRAEFTGQGLGVQAMRARGRVEIYSSFVAGVRLDTAFADVRVAEGRFHVDTATVRAEFGQLSGSGVLALLPELIDSLTFEFTADSLAALRPWLFPGLEPLTGPALGASAGDQIGDDAQMPRLGGSLHASGRVVGNVERLALKGGLEARQVTYGAWGADSLRATDVEVGDLGESPSISGRLRAFGVGLGRLRLDELSLLGAIDDRSATLEFDLSKGRDATASGEMRMAFGQEASNFQLDALALQVGATAWTLTEPATARWAGSGGLELRGLSIMSSAGSIAADASIAEAGPARFTARVDGLQLADAARLWPDSVQIGGLLQLRADLSGSTHDPNFEGSFAVVDGELVGVAFSKLSGTVGYSAGEASIDLSMWSLETRLFRLHGSFPVDVALPVFRLSLPERAIRLTLEGDSIPLTLASLFTDQIADPIGYATAEVLVRGSPEDITLVGPLTLIDGGLRVVRTGISYRDLTGRMIFRGDLMELSDVSFADAEGGRGTLSGSINLSNPRLPVFALQLEAEDLQAYDQVDARAVLSGTARLRGPYDAAVLMGQLSVIEGVMYIDEFSRRAEIVDLFEEGFVLIDTLFALEGTLRRRTDNVFMENLVIDSLEIEVERDTWLRSDETNVEIAGDLSVRMQAAQNELRVDGTLQAVRGDYRLFNKRFEVVEGTIDFVGTPALDPNLHIVSRYTVQTRKRPIEIRLIIGGTLEQPTLTLESDAQPPIPESDLLSYLLFGRPSYELTRTGDQANLLGDVASGVPQAFFGYALGSLLVGETGIAYVDVSRAPQGIDEEVASSAPSALTTTQVEVGWYLAPTVFVSFAQHLVGAVHPTVRVEWRLDKNLTLLGVTEPRLGESATLFTRGSGTDLEQSVGLFLFYGWAY